MSGLRTRGIVAALAAAVLFGASTPAAKPLLSDVAPLMMAGILYLGSGIGLALFCAVRRARTAPVPTADIKWLAAAIFFGGMLAPALLMWGLARVPASGASLLLNMEGVLTALLAWFVFKENFDARIAIGMVLIVTGAAVLAWPGGGGDHGVEPLAVFAVFGACLAWALDNNLTRRASLGDATFIAMLKGLVAGGTNLALALGNGSLLPGAGAMLAGAAIGFFGYGVSLALFVVALREFGAARAGAYFSTAPFAGALLAIVFLGEPVTLKWAAAGVLMAFGVWLHLTERHEHAHTHEPQQHEHEHVHDDAHHDHKHVPPVPAGTRHTHAHRHEARTHRHPHYPDEHHRHGH
jgi:drug/metabolite transporter (DMT)-like permease